MDYKFGDCYVLEVSFRSSNPIHRYIASYLSKGTWEVFGPQMEGVERISKVGVEKKGGYLKVICPVEEINLKIPYEMPHERKDREEANG